MHEAGKPSATRAAIESVAGLAAGWWFGHACGALPALMPGALVAPVALAAGQHGLLAGVLAGAGAGAMVLADAGMGPADVLGFGGDRLTLAAAYAHVVLGTVAGLVGEGHRRARSAAAQRQARLEARLSHAEGAVSTLAAAKHALERRFARQVLPVEALGREAAALAAKPVTEAIPAALALAERFLGARAAAWYEPAGGGWQLARGLGHAPPLGALAAPGSLVVLAAAARGLAAARSPGVRADAGAWLAVPVLGPAGVVGVIALLDLPFNKLTPVAEASLVELACGLSVALAAGTAVEAARPSQGGTIVWLDGPGAWTAERLPEAS